VDCTLGGGGHTEEIKIQNPKSKIYGIDLDQEALEAARIRLAKFENIEFIHDNFRNIKKFVREKVDGILFDLGVSSHQIQEARRGFSLQKDGPLDMRMDPSQNLTAKDILNRSNQDKLQKIFREFGEERFAHRIAKAIVRKRGVEEINTTLELKKIVEKAIPTWRKRESVTRIFQALRIAVNQELDNLKTALDHAIDLLKPGGRIAVISYHSLEDRIAKHTLKKLKVLTKKPLLPSADEISSNPRARSAKLRAAEKT
jgi:16S rRNA (cytosine1402-N4)-methyltransferase